MPVRDDLCEECQERIPTKGSTYCKSCDKATRECRECLEVKSIHEFEKNQRTPSGRRNRRSTCNACRAKKAKPVGKATYQKAYPPPGEGDTFECPICRRMFTVRKGHGKVHLDHDHITGRIRGYVCAECNTGIGNMKGDISTLSNAIKWISEGGDETEKPEPKA